jgi:hypothetical protein
LLSWCFLVGQLIITAFCHEAAGLCLTLARFANWANDDLPTLHYKLGFAIDAALLEQSFSNANASRIADLNEARSHKYNVGTEEMFCKLFKSLMTDRSPTTDNAGLMSNGNFRCALCKAASACSGVSIIEADVCRAYNSRFVRWKLVSYPDARD